MLHVYPPNLPEPLTPLIGREREVERALHFLRETPVRLLTLTGTAGIGKTRLALRLASELCLGNDFADGVYFVPLASLSDPTSVISAIAQVFELREVGNEAISNLLQDYLHNKHLLLVLDNFEQVLSAAPFLAQLLASSSRLKILVTSREVLRVRGEQQFPVLSLALPNLKHLPAPETLSQYAAVALFIQRTQGIRPDFAMSEANARVIAEICVRLDGLPLAIELAAARMNMLSAQALLARLDYPLQVLNRGSRDLPERQQTLYNLLQWSYNLLDMQEQQIFRWLSVFVGGCTLSAIEAIYKRLGDKAEAVFDLVGSLIDKSLLYHKEREDGEVEEQPRFVMLETSRAYALERLSRCGEAVITRQAHAVYYLALVEEAEPKLEGPQQAIWLARLEREHDNLRAALQWFLEQGKRGEGNQHSQQDREMALRFCGALRRFWLVRGHFSEGQSFLEQVLAHREGVAAAVQAKALLTAGTLALLQGCLDQAEAFCIESLALFRQAGEAWGIATTLYQLGREEGLAWTLCILGRIASMEEKPMTARAFYEESISLSRKLNYKELLASGMEGLACVVATQGTVGAPLGESLLPSSQEGAAKAVTEQGMLWAVQLWAVAEALREAVDTPIFPIDRVYYEQVVAGVRAQLGEKTFSVSWAQGRMMTPEQALIAQGRMMTPVQVLLAAQGKETVPRQTSGPAPALSYPTGLTAREIAVLRLVAEGLTSAQIAEQLTITLLTVNSHVRSIYSKLGVTSRSAATRYAIEQKLV